MTKICLNMIVKNESEIIERCLRAVAPHIDYYVILDTGSTDDTIKIIKRTMKKLKVPGIVGKGKFENFSQARNDAMDLARASKFKWDYLLLVDADMELTGAGAPRNPKALLVDPAFTITQRAGEFVYDNVRLVRRDVNAKYVGVTHEFLDLDGAEATHFPTVHFIDHANGSNRADKYYRDIDLLERALIDEPDNARYVFYLAQSHRDAGDLPAATVLYRRRVEMGGWDQEVFYSLFQIAVLMERQVFSASNNWSQADVDAAYLTAWNYRPTRVEPLVEMARRYRNRGQYHLAHMAAFTACGYDKPTDSLFVDASAHDWRAADEFAIALYYIGEYTTSEMVCMDLLKDGVLPDSEIGRVMANLHFAQEGQS